MKFNIKIPLMYWFMHSWYLIRRFDEYDTFHTMLWLFWGSQLILWPKFLIFHKHLENILFDKHLGNIYTGTSIWETLMANICQICISQNIWETFIHSPIFIKHLWIYIWKRFVSINICQTFLNHIWQTYIFLNICQMYFKNIW